MNRSELGRHAEQFLELLFQDLDRWGVSLDAHWDIDHLCYRTSTENEYETRKGIFGKLGDQLIESEVNGRAIATFKLHEAINFRGYRIDLIELPAPKSGKLTPTGFEHIEVVCDVPFHELEARYLDLTFDRKGLEKDLNRELELCLGTRNVKFHHASLESIITLEQNQDVFQALRRSGVLRDLHLRDPLIVGTFPLGIEMKNSDLDILIFADDLSTLAQELEMRYGSLTGYSLETYSVGGEPSVICRFTLEGIPFELFGQSRAPVHQEAFRHYLAEERLLKFGGVTLRESVMRIRGEGSKTEPAFCQALKLLGDPYQLMLKVQRLGTSELRDLIKFL